MITALEARQKAIENQNESSEAAAKELVEVTIEIKKAIEQGHLMCELDYLLLQKSKAVLESKGYYVKTRDLNKKIFTVICW